MSLPLPPNFSNLSVRRYREQLYRWRSHQAASTSNISNDFSQSDFFDRRDSRRIMMGSLVGFLLLEYLGERFFSSFPSGLLFPLGYLLFWGFYYIFYRPNRLEDTLSELPKRKWGASTQNFFTKIFLDIFFEKSTDSSCSSDSSRGKNTKTAYSQPRTQYTTYNKYRSQQKTQTRQQTTQATSSPSSSTASQLPPPSVPSSSFSHSLPLSLQKALQTLELPDTRDWHTIHRRYREYAKKYHPDLNPEITALGRRFIVIDSAYRKLLAAKGQYFF